MVTVKGEPPFKTSPSAIEAFPATSVSAPIDRLRTAVRGMPFFFGIGPTLLSSFGTSPDLWPHIQPSTWLCRLWPGRRDLHDFSYREYLKAAMTRSTNSAKRAIPIRIKGARNSQ
jgi:hypothetical protein